MFVESGPHGDGSSTLRNGPRRGIARYGERAASGSPLTSLRPRAAAGRLGEDEKRTRRLPEGIAASGSSASSRQSQSLRVTSAPRISGSPWRRASWINCEGRKPHRLAALSRPHRNAAGSEAFNQAENTPAAQSWRRAIPESRQLPKPWIWRQICCANNGL